MYDSHVLCPLSTVASDPVLLQQLMSTIPNFPQQLEHLTLMYQQAVLQVSSPAHMCCLIISCYSELGI